MMSRLSQVILGCTVAVLLLIGAGYFGLRWLAASFGPPNESTDVAAYAATLKQWSSSGLVSHFPPSIPPQAKKVRFAAFPGFLQDGAYIQLRIQLPAKEIVAIEERLKKATTHVYVGGDMFDHYNDDQKHNWPTTTFRTADNPKTTFAFPDTFRLYVLSAKDYGAWNHGSTTGVAISSTTNEAVYWADSW